MIKLEELPRSIRIVSFRPHVGAYMSFLAYMWLYRAVAPTCKYTGRYTYTSPLHTTRPYLGAHVGVHEPCKGHCATE